MNQHPTGIHELPDYPGLAGRIVSEVGTTFKWPLIRFTTANRLLHIYVDDGGKERRVGMVSLGGYFEIRDGKIHIMTPQDVPMFVISAGS